MKRFWMLSAFVSAALFLLASSARAQVAVQPRAPLEVHVLNTGGVPGLRGFSVSLVQGDLRAGTATPDGVPAAAAKALADLKDFLPYKNYKMLDTQWMLGSGRMTGRLRGPESANYDFEVQANGLGFGFGQLARGSNESQTSITISRFVLRGVPLDAAAEGAASTNRWNADRMAALYEKGLVAQGTLRQAQLKGAAEALAGRNIIDTSFSMDLGETVVVGTSRLQGDTALIVLLTAVARDAGAARK